MPWMIGPGEVRGGWAQDNSGHRRAHVIFSLSAAAEVRRARIISARRRTNHGHPDAAAGQSPGQLRVPHGPGGTG
jgi:hypothetical protein